MKIARRGVQAALIVLVALAGCARDPYVAVADWTLRTPDGKSRAIHAPQRLDGFLPKHPSVYFLEADVPLPEGMRGRRLTLALPDTHAFATLSVGGEEILPLSIGPFDRIRPSQGQLVFRIPEDQTRRETLHLKLAVQHVDVWTMQLGLAPRLAASAYGERQTRFARYINEVSHAGVGAIFVLLALASAVSFLLDRRRAVDGWYALMTFGIAVTQFVVLGLTQLLDSRDIVRAPILVTPLICVFAVGFTHAYFQLRSSRVVQFTVLAMGLVALVLGWPPFSSSSWPLALTQLEIVLTMLALLATLGRLAWRSNRRLEALCMLGSWLLLATVTVTQNLTHPSLVALPPFAWLSFVVTLGILLLRKHALELRGLNASLQDRVVALEARNRDVSMLNKELTRQTHDRAARLADALGRIGRLSGHKSKPLAIGTLVGERYKVVRALGRGGMGAVYAVERKIDGKHFALKTLMQADSGDWLARLAREAQAATAVVHPNVVSIVDVDVDISGMPFLVMELVDGEPLSAKKARFGDSVFAREVVRQMAAGLSALHQAGIVHRDLKPANVLLESQRDGAFQVKIVDFGIARIASGERASPAKAAPAGVLATDGFLRFLRDETGELEELCAAPMREAHGTQPVGGALTRTGWLLGTPMYMAPELAFGVKDAPPSSDLWSLGVVAYQIGCGRHPFDRPPVDWTEDSESKLQMIDAAGLAQPLRSVVERCLDVDPLRRPSAAEVVAALA
jgi:hypothetical protein